MQTKYWYFIGSAVVAYFMGDAMAGYPIFKQINGEIAKLNGKVPPA